MWPCESGENTLAASGTRSFRAQSHVLLKMTHSRQILAHRPCDKETDTQAKQFWSSYHTTWRLFGQNPAWPRGSLLLEATYPGLSCCHPSTSSRPAPGSPGSLDVEQTLAPLGLGEETSGGGGGHAPSRNGVGSGALICIWCSSDLQSLSLAVDGVLDQERCSPQAPGP